MSTVLRFLSIATLALMTTGCAMPYAASSNGYGSMSEDGALPFGAMVIDPPSCPTPAIPGPGLVSDLPLLSPGDRVELDLDDGAEFTGTYAVDNDGRLRVPYLSPILVRGQSVTGAMIRVQDAMVDQGLLAGTGPRISLVPRMWAAVKVHVSGAVFAPGPVIVNDRTHVETRPDMLTRSGDLTPDRYMSAALRAAGGLRPDANLTNVTLIRDGERHVIDVRPLLDGTAPIEPALLDGDQIVVDSVGIFQERLARPSAVTAPGFRIYASNLSIPSPSNAQSSIAGEATRLPTGARLSHALASANCIGGTQMTNAHRRALLVTRNPITRETTSHVYRVYDVTHRADLPAANPYLLPEDAVACFDGPVPVARDLARTALDFLLPVQVLKNIENGYRLYD
ncbi:MAG: polysaccharide export protein [Pseudomonadota bacterium]